MTARSAQEWEALLDGTTPGPWEAHQRHDEFSIHPTRPDLADRYVGDVYGRENADPAAVAPEAVAEVVRLREELEALRDKAQDVLEFLAEAGGDFMTATPANKATRFQLAIQITDLTRILEGKNNE